MSLTHLSSTRALVCALSSMIAVCSACSQEPASSEALETSSRASAFEVDLPSSELEGEGPLPAFLSEREVAFAKEDRFDTRGSYRDIYGVTSPARGPLRAVAEFEPTEGVLIAWDWSLSEYLFELIVLSASRAPVWVITENVNTSQRLGEALKRAGVSAQQVRFFEFRNDGVWTRDFGPWTVVDAQGLPSFLDVIYYPNRRRDDAVPTLMSRHFGVPVYRPELEIEGGNFMTDGEGRCFFSSRVLEVNVALDAEELTDLFYQYVGCERALVLEPLYGEGTGHIDMFTKLVGPNTLLLGAYNEGEDPMNATLLERNLERIERFAEASEWPLEVIRVPMPPARRSGAYPSYTNSLILNDLVVIPVYPSQDRYEGAALEAYQRAMPTGYELVTINADEVIERGGAVHCTTMSFNLTQGFVAPAKEGERPVLDSGEPSSERVFSSSPQLPISDLSVARDTIEVPALSPAPERATVSYSIAHSYPGDLTVTLQKGAQRVELFDREQTNAGSLERTATLSVRGLDVSGGWTLELRDQEERDEGVLLNWALRFE